jgi:hypothetical protein
MQETDPTSERDETAEPISTQGLRRLLYLAFAALALLLLVLLPPLISVNRYQRRIATSIGDSLGRPVHLDRVSLNLLPLPGFTLENFVVSEDPAFGSEPIIRANSVRATLRLSSLWSKRVEFSTISFTEPSVNLVHAASGKWNIESILLHAAHIDAAPTAQRRAGPAPRFPYIEATGARLNLKLDQEKTPMSLTDAEFALWLPDPQQWHLRLQAHPARTDTGVSDTGLLQVDGTLGRASSLGQVPINLTGEWSGVPLGEASRVLFGRDAGLRGDMTLSASAQGTVGTSTVQTRLQLTNARRSAFVPDTPLNVDLQCLAIAINAFHGFENLRCDWPPSGSSGTPTLAITGSFPDIRRLDYSTIDAVTPGLPAATLLEWLHIASSRVPADISVAGSFTGNLGYHSESQDGLPPGWSGKLSVTGASLIAPHAGPSSLLTGDINLQSTTQIAPEAHRAGVVRAEAHRERHQPPQPSLAFPLSGFQLAPTSLALGGKDPATLDGYFDSTGYTLHLTGMASTARMLALAAALPQFGDGLAQVLPTNRTSGPFRVDLIATRTWGGTQIWTDATTHPAASHPRHHPRT